MKLRSILILLVVAGGFLAGCTSYYRVTQPGNGQTFYTDRIDRKESGAIVFKDAATQMEITLPSSEIQQITKEQYESGKAQPTPGPSTRP